MSRGGAAKRAPLSAFMRGLIAAATLGAFLTAGGAAASDLSNISDPAAALANLNQTAVNGLDFVPKSLRLGITAGTGVSDCSSYIAAARARMTQTGATCLVLRGALWRLSQSVELGGAPIKIVFPDWGKIAFDQPGDAITITQTDYTHTVHIVGARAQSLRASGCSNSVFNINFPLTDSYSRTNLVFEDVIIRADNSWSINQGALVAGQNSFKFGAVIKGGWLMRFSRFQFWGAAPPTYNNQFFPGSAALSIDRCIAMVIDTDCIALNAEFGIWQAGYCEGVYDSGQYGVGTAYENSQSPFDYTSGSTFKLQGAWFCGQYATTKAGFNIFFPHNLRFYGAGEIGRIGGDPAAPQDWGAIYLTNPVSAHIDDIDIQAVRFGGEATNGLIVKYDSSLGGSWGSYASDVVVNGALIQNCSTALSFGPGTSDCHCTRNTFINASACVVEDLGTAGSNSIEYRVGKSVMQPTLANNPQISDAAAALAGYALGEEFVDEFGRKRLRRDQKWLAFGPGVTSGAGALPPPPAGMSYMVDDTLCHMHCLIELGDVGSATTSLLVPAPTTTPINPGVHMYGVGKNRTSGQRLFVEADGPNNRFVVTDLISGGAPFTASNQEVWFNMGYDTGTNG